MGQKSRIATDLYGEFWIAGASFAFASCNLSSTSLRNAVSLLPSGSDFKDIPLIYTTSVRRRRVITGVDLLDITFRDRGDISFTRYPSHSVFECGFPFAAKKVFGMTPTM